MDTLIQSSPSSVEQPSFWRDPGIWLQQANLERGYWVFFTAAFFFDAGFAIYFFLFNLYLLDCGFNERVIGLIGGAITFGSLVGTLPIGALSQRYGVRPVLLILFVMAPLTNATRALWIWEPAQIGLAFITGFFMSSWGVCFLQAVARLTTEKNRASGFSLIFSVSVGTSMIGGIICGYLQQWLGEIGIVLQPIAVKRLILLISCAIAFLGIFAVRRLSIPKAGDGEVEHSSRRRKSVNGFLIRFLPCMAMWSAVLAAFIPFANIYLTRGLHISMARIGIIFSTVQIVQLCMGLLTPIIFRAIGLTKGIVTTQLAAVVTLVFLATAKTSGAAVLLYLTFSAAQWMSSPGLYSLLMDRTPDADRSRTAAMIMFANSLFGSLATALTGMLLTRYGYPPVFIGIAAVACAVTMSFYLLIARNLNDSHKITEQT